MKKQQDDTMTLKSTANKDIPHNILPPSLEMMHEIVEANKQHQLFVAKLEQSGITIEELCQFIASHFKELENQYKERIKDLFHELTMLSNEPQTHLFKKTTYKVELTLQDWKSLQDRYLQ